MNSTVSFRHMKASDPIRMYVEEKVTKLDKFFDHGAEAHVTLSVEKHQHFAHIELRTSGAMRMRSDEKSEDMYSSIDAAVEKIVKQVKRYRSKVRDQHRDTKSRELSHQVIEVPRSRSDDDAIEQPQVVRQETIVAKEMNRDDAVLQMDLLNTDFLVYTDPISHHVHVMYRLDDGQYGLIETMSDA